LNEIHNLFLPTPRIKMAAVEENILIFQQRLKNKTSDQTLFENVLKS